MIEIPTIIYTFGYLFAIATVLNALTAIGFLTNVWKGETLFGNGISSKIAAAGFFVILETVNFVTLYYVYRFLSQ